jgi:hypothetical protein
LGRFGDEQLEIFLGLPLNRTTGLKAEETEDPMFVGTAPAAPELAVEIDMANNAPARVSSLVDGLDTSHLPGPHDLMLVDQEDGDPGCVDEFLHLASTAPLPGVRALPRRPLANAVGFITDQDVQPVSFSTCEVEEITEEFWNSDVLSADDVPKSGSEGLRSGGVDNASPVPPEVSHQVQRNDAFTRTRTPGYHYDFLLVRLARQVRRPLHQTRRHLLLIHQEELTAVDYLGSSGTH